MKFIKVTLNDENKKEKFINDELIESIEGDDTGSIITLSSGKEFSVIDTPDQIQLGEDYVKEIHFLDKEFNNPSSIGPSRFMSKEFFSEIISLTRREAISLLKKENDALPESEKLSHWSIYYIFAGLMANESWEDYKKILKIFLSNDIDYDACQRAWSFVQGEISNRYYKEHGEVEWYKKYRC